MIGVVVQCDQCGKIRPAENAVHHKCSEAKPILMPYGWRRIDYYGTERHFCSKECLNEYTQNNQGGRQ
jgi:hypothetical protein